MNEKRDQNQSLRSINVWGEDKDELTQWPIKKRKNSRVLLWKSKKRAVSEGWRGRFCWMLPGSLESKTKGIKQRNMPEILAPGSQLLLLVACALEVQGFTIQKDLSAATTYPHLGVISFEADSGRWRPLWEIWDSVLHLCITAPAPCWQPCFHTS